MNANIMKLANRFSRILKSAEPAVSMQLADAQDILATTVGVTISGGSASLNAENAIIKDINAAMDKLNLQNFKGHIQIGTDKSVKFNTSSPQITDLLNKKYSAKCTQLLKADKRVPTDDIVWTDWVVY